MNDSSNLLEIIKSHSVTKPNQVACEFLYADNTDSSRLTYFQLDQQARCIANYLQNYSLDKDARVLLVFPAGLEFIKAFIGCLYAGLISVPVSFPKPNRSLKDLERIINDATIDIVLGTEKGLSILQQGIDQRLNYININEALTGKSQDWFQPPINPQAIVFLQYTSGSTGDPKGVMVSHKNLLHNLAHIYHCFGHNDQSRVFSWLPHYHDMGLVGGILQPLYGGFPVYLMSPFAFIQNPYLWLKLISKYKITTSGGPNFAYDLCIEKISNEQKNNVDLSSWDLAFTGSEVINSETLDSFSRSFKQCGFCYHSFYPCYGMAEATLMATTGKKEQSPILKTIDYMKFHDRQIVYCEAKEQGTKTMVSCGQTLSDQVLKVVDPHTRLELLDSSIGEIWLKGKSIAQGYWQKEKINQEIFGAYLDNEGPFFRTGDLGFTHRGEVFITGRLKEMLVIRGRNYYPQDIEKTILNAHSALKLGGGAVFSGEGVANDKLVIIHEIKRKYVRHLDGVEILRCLQTVVSQEYGLNIDDLVLIKPNSLKKTSSGKTKRYLMKKLYIQDQIESLFSSKKNTNFSMTDIQNLTYDSLIQVSGTRQKLLLAAYTKTILAGFLQCDISLLDSSQSIQELGLDSVQLVDLKLKLDQVIGSEFPLEKFMELPSIEVLAETALTQLNQNLNTTTIELESSEKSSELMAPGPKESGYQEILSKINSGFFDYLHELENNYGELVRLQWGNQIFYMISNPHNLKTVFMEKTEIFIRGQFWSMFQKIMGNNGLITSEGKLWQEERKIAQPEFIRFSIESFGSNIKAAINQHLKQWESKSYQNEPVNLIDDMKKLTLQIILEKLFSKKQNLETESKLEQLFSTLKDVDELWNVPLDFILQGSHSANQVALSSSKNNHYDIILNQLDPIIFTWVDEHLSHPEQFQDLISHYIASELVQQKNPSEQRQFLRDVAITIILTGFDTTASGLFWCFYLLDQNPSILQQVRQELQSNLINGVVPTDNLFNQLPYTCSTINESLRLYPPVWYVGRQITQTTQLGDYTLEKDALILASPYVVHRTSKLWDNPEKFEPKRFLNKEVIPNSYIPFGLGPRTCIGKTMALYEMTLTLALVLQRYQVSIRSDSPIELSTLFTLRPKDKIYADIQSY